MEDIKEEKFDLLDQLHHLTSGMKSVYTQVCLDGIFAVRQSIGGAGFSAWGGIVQIIDEMSPTVTYEGDNTVMFGQASRYLVKLVAKANKKGSLEFPFNYLNEMQ
jgi:hypothetical protein